MSSLREFLTSIANAIRNKKGTTAPINAQNFASEIESIETGNDKSSIYKALEKMGTNWSYAFYTSSYPNKTLLYNLTEVKESDFPPSNNVTDMTSMFSYSKVASIPRLDTSNVTSMERTFYECKGITSVPQLDTSNVTNMDSTFAYCTNLILIPQLNTSKVTSMSSAFRGCYFLPSVPQLDTSNVTNMQYIFYGSANLISIPRLDTSKVLYMNRMFDSCNKLLIADITLFNLSDANYSDMMFKECYSLKQVIIRSFGSYTLNSNAFDSCYHLTGTVNSTYNPNGDKDCYIYVPRAMVDTLKSATNWSTYASQIRALEDYTVDGTTDGDLDESKI